MSVCVTSSVLLTPRPYAKEPGILLLLPLLPQPKPVKPLPAEIWVEIFAFSLLEGNIEAAPTWPWSLALVCKAFNATATPLLYTSVNFTKISALEKFHKLLHTSDQKWDSIRRIPYSTPGRWVQRIDLSALPFQSQSQAFQLDSILVNLVELTPFLSDLSVNPSFVLSRRVLSAIGDREGAKNIRCLSGFSYIPPLSSAPDEDPFVKLLRKCHNIEELVIVGQGLDPTELEFNFAGVDIPAIIAFVPLHLPKLRLLSILSMHSSPLMQALLRTPLPGLQKLTLTPYEDILYPASLSTEFISTHGAHLSSLMLFTPKSWPTRLRPSSENILSFAPSLNHLSLETPVPNLKLTDQHGLRILSIPRPTADTMRILECILPKLPNLAIIRARDVRWLPKGLSSMAQTAGVQGEMKDWKRKLGRYGIKFVDADWN